MKIKRKYLALVILAANITIVKPVYAGGVPTIDVIAIAKLVKEAVETKKRYEELLAQGVMLKTQFSELKQLPEELLKDIRNLDFDDLGQALQNDVFSEYGLTNADHICNDATNVAACKKEKDKIFTVLEGVNKIGEEMNKKMGRLATLASSVNSAKTPKQVAVAQAAIESEMLSFKALEMQANLAMKQFELNKEMDRRVRKEVYKKEDVIYRDNMSKVFTNLGSIKSESDLKNIDILLAK